LGDSAENPAADKKEKVNHWRQASQKVCRLVCLMGEIKVKGLPEN
jgi:hypothetical protein